MAKPKIPPGVSLDKNAWLSIGEIPSTNAPMDIDSWIEATGSFWQALETECVIACCGIEALSFWPGELVRARSVSADPQLLQQLKSLRTFVAERPDAAFVSHRLNQWFSADFLIRLLDHIVYYLNEPTACEP